MKTKKIKPAVPVRATKCMTCPFRHGSPHADLAPLLALEAMKTNRVCHSTGGPNAITTITGAKAHICRGAREVQLEAFAAMGFIKEPTDAEWNRRRAESGLAIEIIKATIP
jgi:hypothetical protein